MATQSKALAQAYAAAKHNTIILHTLEVNHKSFAEPIRVCRYPVTDNQPDIIALRLEDDAPYNPGQVVDFIGVPFNIVTPDNSTDSIGEFQISLDNVADTLHKYLRSAVIHGGQITAIYRDYVRGEGESDNGPGQVSHGIKIMSPKKEGSTIVFTGAVLGWTQRSYGYLYTAGGYPGLVRGR
ncbi:DUF1833 domain-containing protein [Desulfovibrio sp. OttesenSCG-928-A18]|nr:DUF1833 domain-containing protein [Desulfovibrio sp. OttesenSCG-928-A18]